MFKNILSIFAIPTDDGYGGVVYDLTTVGYVALVIGMFAILLVAAAITKRLTNKTARISIHQLAYSAMAIALAAAATMIPMPRMPMGGHITPFSLLIIALIGYWFGLSGGIACGVAFGILLLLLDPYILSLPQMLCDYVFAFGALGLSGIFSKNSSVLPGYLIAVTGRYIFAVLSGVIFFASYAPESGILSNAWLYSIVYNIIYIGTEAALTVAILQIPAFRSAINTVGNAAMKE